MDSVLSPAQRALYAEAIRANSYTCDNLDSTLDVLSRMIAAGQQVLIDLRVNGVKPEDKLAAVSLNTASFAASTKPEQALAKIAAEPANWWHGVSVIRGLDTTAEAMHTVFEKTGADVSPRHRGGLVNLALHSLMSDSQALVGEREVSKPAGRPWQLTLDRR